MEAWLHGVDSGLRASEAALLTADKQGETSFPAFVESWRCRGLAGSPCTSVWAVGAIAYRCRTCQTNDSSAICVACFKAGGHEVRRAAMLAVSSAHAPARPGA